MFKTDCVSLSLFSLLLSLLFSRFSVLCVFHVLVVARFSFLPVFFHSTSCSEALSCTLLFSVLPFLVVLAFCSVGLVLVEMGKHYANLVSFSCSILIPAARAQNLVLRFFNRHEKKFVK